MNTVTMEGAPLHLEGQFPEVGKKAPDFTALTNDRNPESSVIMRAELWCCSAYRRWILRSAIWKCAASTPRPLIFPTR